MTNIRLHTAAALLLTVILTAACGAPASPSPSAAPSTDPSTAPSSTPSAAPSIAPDPGDEFTGLVLGDIDAAALIDAFTQFGFSFASDDRADLEDGTHVIYGDKDDDDGAVRAAIHIDSNTPLALAIYDFSGGELGLEEMGFAIGLLEPTAQAWLIEQLETALSDPSTPLTATQQFGNNALTLSAFADEQGAIELIFE